jgi:hypothetical protein
MLLEVKLKNERICKFAKFMFLGTRSPWRWSKITKMFWPRSFNTFINILYMFIISRFCNIFSSKCPDKGTALVNFLNRQSSIAIILHFHTWLRVYCFSWPAQASSWPVVQVESIPGEGKYVASWAVRYCPPACLGLELVSLPPCPVRHCPPNCLGVELVSPLCHVFQFVPIRLLAPLTCVPS